MFIDYAHIYAISGKGGDGCLSFRREKYVPKGGPDGGDGGKGGSVYFQGDRNLGTLMDFRYQRKYAAQKGEQGMGRKRFGKDGQDLIIRVPVGTIVSDKNTGEVLADCKKDGQKILLLRGGKGGKGNVHFATATNQAPRKITKGQPAQERELVLELKLLSDIGLVGLPNAGKSTLLSVITAARPEVASYPFTTLTPHLGVVRIGPEFSFTVADIPGLIEGAHENKGLGHEFLRHVQRTRLLVFMLDMAEPVGENAAADLEVLFDEIKCYDPELLNRPRVIGANKMDIPEAEERLNELKASHPDETFFPMSAAIGEGIKELLKWMSDSIRLARQNDVFEEEENDEEPVVDESGDDSAAES